MSLSLRGSSKHASVERYSISVTTVKEELLPKVRRYLEPTLRTILAETEQQIRAAVHNCELLTMVTRRLDTEVNLVSVNPGLPG